ncbi:MAG: CHAT domain-containing protein, partial [Leptolyngbya sp. SIO4C1]|nr:CHAT domain-containing protein [Leptolyngbya sp. SIO4C1]
VSACLSAGARHVLSTLWRVESEASMVLMVEFYRRLQRGLAPAEALKQAQSFLAHAKRETLYDWFTEALALIPDTAVQPLLRVRQEKFEQPGAEQPFSHFYFWAPFTITTL